MRPYAGESLEVSGMIFRVVGIVPEPDRHRGKRLGADQLTVFIRDRFATFIENLDRHSKRDALQLAAPDRQYRIAGGKTADNVGAAGDRCKLDVFGDRVIDIVEALGRQRRTGRENGSQIR